MQIANNILVATDFSELGQRAVEQATMMAERLGAKLNVVSVLTLGTDYETPQAEEAALEERRIRLAALETQLVQTGRLGRALILVGDPTTTILRAAEDLQVDLLVLGTHGRRGLSRLALGSTAEQVMRRAHVPVLVVKAAAPKPAPRGSVPWAD